MICKFFIFALFLLGGSATPSRDRNDKPYRVVCYLGTWANYRHGNGKFVIEDVDPYICTHAIYAFAKLENNRIEPYDAWLDLESGWGLKGYQRFNALREKNPTLTTLIALGGWNEGSIKYSEMAANVQSRKIFVKSVLEFLEEHDFDGLDFDWEYPANRGGKPEDRENFVILLKELKEAFEPYGYLLTGAVSAGKNTIDTAYDVPGMSKYMDFINVMSYDLHGAWESVTGHNSPLYSRPDEDENDKILNMDFAINYWIELGAPKEKLVLGTALYGRTFTLENPEQNGLGQPTKGAGHAGKYTRENGMIGYNEITEQFKEQPNQWTIVYNQHQKIPYTYKGDQWIGYDDLLSIRTKIDYLKALNISGAMVWSVETDDFKGLSSERRYPLLSLIFEMLNGEVVRPSTPQPISTSEPDIPGTLGPNEIVCTEEGYFRHPETCKKFYHCLLVHNTFKVYIFNCPGGTLFDQDKKYCEHAYLVKDCDK